MKFIVAEVNVDKDETLELFETVWDFQDEYIDSYLDQIVKKINKELGIDLDGFSDNIWLNSFIIFKSNEEELFRTSFDNFVKYMNDDEDVTPEFEEVLKKLKETLPEEFIIEIIFDDEYGNYPVEEE